ncbi:MAG: LuxR C-terminal-related transcriptional regulator [Treponema sp.]|jgi:LuxR family maltose regulon positive regulatory protein|nr:LuxR C-terminal-related transcriptional regulator [Treponema sp.]
MPEQLFHSNMPIAPGNQIYLERPWLDRLLEQAAQKPVVIVIAGAGYGKTHAVYSFVRKYKVLINWMQLSERDNIGERFWENFISGVSVISGETAAKLAVLSFPSTDRQFDHYLKIPRDDVLPEEKYIIVFDDLHLLTDSSVLHFLERSVTSPFPNITSILISRTEPPLNLMNLESKGLLTRITEEDLRFTRDEMESYFQLLQINAPPQTLSSIYHDTEGWAFAIHLAGLSLKNAPTGAAYANHALRSNIFKLIASEIMAPLPLPVQRFLIKMSLIEHLVPELLEELAGDPSLIPRIKRIDSFIRFDIYLNSYHIHHLFLDYLKTRQDELTDYDKMDLWHKTAAWCAANNQKMDAISYYEKAGDYDRIIDICSTLPMMLSNRTARMLLELLDMAPREIYENNPLIYTHRVRILMSLGMIEQADQETKDAISRFEALPPSPLNHRILMICYGNSGFIRMMVSPYTKDYNFTADFERCAYHGGLSGGYTVPLPMSVLNIGSYICRVTSPEKGEIERYIDAVEIVAPLAMGPLGGMEWGADTLARTELAFFKGDMPQAEQFAMLTLQRAQEWDQYEVENRALFYLLRISLARGNYEAVSGIFRQLEAQLDQVHFINRFTYHDVVTGWYYAQIGRMDKVAPWLKNDFEGSDLTSMNLGMEVLVKAKCHLTEKRYPAALAALTTMEARKNPYDAGDFVLGRITMKALEAVCRYRNRDKQGAFAALETAYLLARPNALYMPFTELGKDMRALVEGALKNQAPGLPSAWLETTRRGASAYAKKLFTVAEQYRPALQGVNLSLRELEVLTGLSQGMTQEEIAGRSSLSVNTVKSVIRGVYNKLGAVNKADAVRIAAAAGILGAANETS